VAGFVAHSADPFGRKEIALLYLLYYIALFVLGSGKYSIDYLLTRKRADS
jgi:putative oxidoreductase